MRNLLAPALKIQVRKTDKMLDSLHNPFIYLANQKDVVLSHGLYGKNSCSIHG